jgi:hypothetical protein
MEKLPTVSKNLKVRFSITLKIDCKRRSKLIYFCYPDLCYTKSSVNFIYQIHPQQSPDSEPAGIIHIGDGCIIWRTAQSQLCISATTFSHWKKTHPKNAAKTFKFDFPSSSERDLWFEMIHGAIVQKIPEYIIMNQNLFFQDDNEIFCQDFMKSAQPFFDNRVFKIPLLTQKFCKDLCNEVEQFSAHHRRQLVTITLFN